MLSTSAFDYDFEYRKWVVVLIMFNKKLAHTPLFKSHSALGRILGELLRQTWVGLYPLHSFSGVQAWPSMTVQTSLLASPNPSYHSWPLPARSFLASLLALHPPPPYTRISSPNPLFLSSPHDQITSTCIFFKTLPIASMSYPIPQLLTSISTFSTFPCL